MKTMDDLDSLKLFGTFEEVVAAVGNMDESQREALWLEYEAIQRRKKEPMTENTNINGGERLVINGFHIDENIVPATATLARAKANPMPDKEIRSYLIIAGMKDLRVPYGRVIMTRPEDDGTGQDNTGRLRVWMEHLRTTDDANIPSSMALSFYGDHEVFSYDHDYVVSVHDGKMMWHLYTS